MRLTAYQSDTLLELINIGVGRASGMLNRLVNSHVQLQVPELKIFSPEEFRVSTACLRQDSVSSVSIAFSGNFSGLSALVFPRESAIKLAAMVLEPQGRKDFDDALRFETLQEIGNIVLGGVMGSMANIMKERLQYAAPSYMEGTLQDILSSGEQSASLILLARTHFSIKDHRIGGEVLIVFSLESFDLLLSAIDGIAGT